MTDLVLVRHGETVWHAENRYAGVSEVELSARGLEQAAELARWASSAGLSAVWSSPQGRALGTATACADLAGLRLQVDARLRELDFGDGEGLTAARDARTVSRGVRCLRHRSGRQSPARRRGSCRGCRAVRLCLETSPEPSRGRVLVVAHKTVIRLALCQLLGAPLRDYRRLFPAIGNCSLTEIRMTGRRAALLRFNVPAAPIEPNGRRAERAEAS